MLHEDNRSKRRRLAPIAAICAVGIVAAACQSSSGGSATGTSALARARHRQIPSSSTSLPPAEAPGRTPQGHHGHGDQRHDQSVSVTDGLTGQRAVTGTLSSSKTSWHSDWTLPVDQTLTVTATAVGSGHSITQTSTFKTLRPVQTFATHIFEGYKDHYGVGMPIMLTFSQPIKNRAAVERSLQIITSKPVVGAWYWDNSQTLSFRPRDYWPAHTNVASSAT